MSEWGGILDNDFRDLGGRPYLQVGILMQGKPPKLGDILRWAVRG